MSGPELSAPSASDGHNSLQFFDALAPLVVELGRTMCVALDQGYAAVCFVSAAARDALEQQLTDRGIDVATVRNRGQYLCFDAAATIPKIVVAGSPDRIKFSAVVGDLIDRLSGEYKGVWMYGELAAQLWIAGDETGAMELESLWTSLADTHPVCLCVAFPVEILSRPAVLKSVQQVVADQLRTLAKDSPLALALHRGPNQNS